MANDRQGVQPIIDSTLRAFIDTSPICIIVSDVLTNRVVLANAEASRLFGYSEHEAISKTSSELNIWERPLEREFLAETLKLQGYVSDYECRLRKKNGEMFYALMACKLFEFKGVPSVLISILDISDRKKLENMLQEELSERKIIATQLKQQNEVFQYFAHHINQVFWVRTPEKFIYISPSFEKIFGRSNSSLYLDAKNFIEAVHPEDRSRVLDIVKSNFPQGTFDDEVRILTPAGEERWLRVRSVLPEKNSPYTVGMAEDITLSRAAQIERREMESQIFHAAKLASIGTLAAGIAHEINNPMTIIDGHITILKQELEKEFPGSSKIERLTKVQNAVKRISKIVNGLRSFAHDDKESEESVNLNTAINDTVNFIEQILIKEDISLKIELDPFDPWLVGASGKIQQTLLNLITNAKDALLDKVGDKNILIKTRVIDGKEVKLIIEDNGCGIRSEVLSRIFDPFFTTKPAGAGTGLGLSITHSLVTQMGGKIEFESKENYGTTFTLSFPCHNKSPCNAEQFAERGSILFKVKGRALIVDDEIDILDILESSLSEIGFLITRAGDGAEALNILKKESFDFVFTDIKMPRMSGDQLLREIRALNMTHLKNTSYIVVTGNIINENRDNQLELYSQIADAVIKKPFYDIDLIKAIQSIIVKKNLNI